MGGAPGWLRGLDLTREQREKIYNLLEPVRAQRQQQARERFVEGPGGDDGIRDLIVSGKLTKRDAVRIATERAEQMKQQLIKDAEVMGAIYEDVLTAEQRQTLQEGMKRAQENRGDRFQRRRQMRGGDAAFRQGPAVFRDESAQQRGRTGAPPDLL